MKKFSYLDKWSELLTPNIVSLLTSIHEFKGEQNLIIESNVDKLEGLVEIAKIQSTDASNKIEGIRTSNERLKKIVMDKTMPKTRDEEEIAGYRDVLSTIHQHYEYIPILPSYLLQLHGDLFRFSSKNEGGKYKNSNNVIAEIDEFGNKKVRFTPVESWRTSIAIEELCDAYREAMYANIEPLLVIPMFILDFLCIHPFNDGNGRMSRLLTLLLLYKSNYTVGQYVSIEKIIEKSKETYYEALQQSSYKWHDNENDYAPFVEYYLGVIIAAYREFSKHVQSLISTNISKPERVKEIIKTHIGQITKAEIAEMCPDISNVTIQRALADMVSKNEIVKIGGGRYTYYIWNWEDNYGYRRIKK